MIRASAPSIVSTLYARTGNEPSERGVGACADGTAACTADAQGLSFQAPARKRKMDCRLHAMRSRYSRHALAHAHARIEAIKFFMQSAHQC